VIARTAADTLVSLERDGPAARVLVVACVAQTTDRPHYGIFTRRQVESVRRLGIRCDLLAIAGFETPLAYVHAAARLIELGRDHRHRYALVHAHGGEAALVASVYRKAPLLVSYQGSDILGSPDESGRLPLRWRVRRGLTRQHARLADATIVKSACMIDGLPRTVRRRSRVIPNGVDRERFSPMDREAARAMLAWRPEERVVLFASDPSRPSKRLGLAKAACELASKRIGLIRLEIAHGRPPETIPVLMNASDCLLHPSASEGSPNVVKEALACNLPIVATPVGDIPELLAEVKHSYVCAPEATSLAQALVRSLDPPKRSDGRLRSVALDARTIANRVAAYYMEIGGPEVCELALPREDELVTADSTAARDQVV
jgi:teichuronic acid biosynthesis glycosyltransferase TuaC